MLLNIKYLPALLVGTFLMALTACSDDPELPGADAELDAEDIENINSYEQALLAFRDGQATAEAYADTIGEGSRVASCALTSVDTLNGTFNMTLDFGDGCTGPFGVTRKGILRYQVVLTGLTSFDFVLTFEEYEVEGYLLNGSIATGNIQVDETTGAITYDYRINNGEVINPAGERVLINQNYRYTFDFSSFEIAATGTTTGQLDGTSFTHLIREPLVLRASCPAETAGVPVLGLVDFTWGAQPPVSIDYGDGTCDNEVTLTLGGVSQTITL